MTRRARLSLALWVCEALAYGAVAALVLLATDVRAADVPEGSGALRPWSSCPVGIMVGSVHFDPNREDQFSGVNPGAYVLCERWTAGLYRDSRRRTAAFGGLALQNEGLALVLGLKATRDGVEAFAAGSIRIGPVRLIATPPIGKTPAALAVAGEF